ncbi:MAG: ABC transporter permease [Clostridia bacterium]|nr:ABC transporter permease [Clostridia bacterium]
MKWIDILSQSLQNLLRRKLRSLLTMLGVVIGTAAIVVTMSLGAGAEKAQMEALESTTNLKLVQVYPFYGYDTSATGQRRVTKITDSVIRDIRAMDGVSAVTPMVNVWFGGSFALSTGKYENSYAQLLAVYPEDFAKIKKLKSGRYFSGSTDRMEFIMSEIAMLDFRDPKKEYEWVDYYSILDAGGELPLPDINWLGANYKLILRWEDYSQAEPPNYEPEITEKEFKARMVGVMPADLNDWQFSYYTVCNLNWLKKIYKENKSWFKEMGFEMESYDNVYVLADTVEDVEEIIDQLNDYGLQYSSPLEMVAIMKEQIATVQSFLGFIGAISMLVAALSIANTMMMSIYERTREIGVMKVLGCRLSNIRMMFLMEAAYIGVFGGGLGLIASYSLSYALNNVQWIQEIVASFMSGSAIFETGGSSTSVISPQLALGTWAGVVAVSVLSGLYPAYRAMRLSSLAAIRNAD